MMEYPLQIHWLFFLGTGLEETIYFPRSLRKVFNYIEAYSETDVLKTFKTHGVFQTKCILPLVRTFLGRSLTFARSTKNNLIWKITSYVILL